MVKDIPKQPPLTTATRGFSRSMNAFVKGKSLLSPPCLAYSFASSMLSDYVNAFTKSVKSFPEEKYSPPCKTTTLTSSSLLASVST